MESVAARWGLLLALILAPVAAEAQDSHYWTRQFGNRAWLLGGSFVSNPKDISAVYYNPGALALLDKPEIELAGSIYEITRLSVEGARGTGRDSSMLRADALPSLIAGSMTFGFLGKSKLAYSLITRQGFSFTLESREMVSGTDLAGHSGLEQLSSDVRFDENVGEYWAGVTWAYPLGEHLGVGVTPFGAWRQQEMRSQVQALGTGSDGRTLLSDLGRDFNMTHVRLLAKLGLSYQNASWSMGLAVTTPSLPVWSTARSGFERALVEQGFGLTSVPTPAFNYQDSLSARYHSSWALALGVSKDLGSTTLHLAAEGFVREAPFKLIDTEPFSPQGSSEVIDPDVFFGLARVVNIGLGVEHRLSPKTRAYISAHTDFSAWTETPDRNALVAAWDIYHVTGGMHFTVGRSRFTLGTNVAWGRQSTQRLAQTLTEAGFPPVDSSQKVRFFAATFIVGASVELGPERTSSGDTGTPEEPPHDGGT